MTPPPVASQSRLIDVLAARAAAGEAPPGIADGDELLEGRSESDAENNAAAVRATEHRRRIKPIPPADKSSRTAAGATSAWAAFYV